MINNVKNLELQAAAAGSDDQENQLEMMSNWLYYSHKPIWSITSVFLSKSYILNEKMKYEIESYS